MRAALLAVVVSSVLTCACDRAALMKKLTPTRDYTFVRERVDLLRQHRYDEIERELDSSIAADPNVHSTLAAMAGMFPADEPKSVKVVDVKILHNADYSTHSLTLEYEYPTTWLLVNLSIKRTNGLPTISTFNVTPIADSLENINRFNLVGKSGLQYVILILAVALPAFCIYVLVLCLRMPNLKFKWLWAIFIFVGWGRLAVNWTTGEWTVTPFALNIPCASITAVPAYGPWVVAVFLPLGAILFLLRPDDASARSPGEPSTQTLTPTQFTRE